MKKMLYIALAMGIYHVSANLPVLAASACCGGGPCCPGPCC